MTYDNTDNNDDGTIEADIDNQSVSTDDITINNVGVKGFLSSEQTIPDSTFTKVNIDADSFDDGNELDATNNKIVVDNDGKYLVVASGNLSGLNDGARFIVEPRVNGNRIGRQYLQAASAGSRLGTTISLIESLTAGDEVELYVFQDTGGDRTLNSDADQTSLSVVQLG